MGSGTRVPVNNPVRLPRTHRENQSQASQEEGLEEGTSESKQLNVTSVHYVPV